MMDEIMNGWKALGDDLHNKKRGIVEEFSHNSSDLLLEKLNRKMKLGLMWNIALIVLLLVLGIYHRHSGDILCLVFAYFLLLFGNLLFSGRHYLRVRKGAIMHDNSRKMLESYLKGVKIILRFERIWSLFVIPLSLILAILFSQLLRYGSFREIKMEPAIMIVAAVLMVTAVPVMILWTVWSQRKAYDNEIRELKEMISLLSATE